MDAGTLNCPSCGAVVPEDSLECPYCKSPLQTVACPSCLTMMFEGTKFCPLCGFATETLHHGLSVPHACPRCPKLNLQIITLGQIQLEECPHCGGLWVPSNVFEKICLDQQAQESALHVQLPPPLPDLHTVQYLACPQCAQLMNRHNFAYRSGVIIDQCKSHGIWLDRNELPQIIAYIRAGGLSQARQEEITQLQASRETPKNDELSYGPGPGPVAFPVPSIADQPNTNPHVLSGIASVVTWLLR